MKWLLILLPFLLQASPQEELFKIFDIPTDRPQAEIVETAKSLWLQQEKERWHFEVRYEYLRPQVWPLFEQMGMIEDIKPAETHYDYVLVFGALLLSVQDRVQYLAKLDITFDQLVFLTGARPLLDSEKEKLPGCETETDMMKWVYDHSDLPRDVSVVFIDVPMKDGKRPTTIGTLTAWLKTNPSEGTCLAISNQPYVHYQDAVLKQTIPFETETVGPAVRAYRPGYPSVDLMLDTIAGELIYKQGEKL